MRPRILCWLCLLPVVLPAQTPKRCIPELLPGANQARRVEQFGENVTLFLGGKVRFRCQGQNVQLGADSVQIVNENIYMFMGQAFYRDSAFSVTADTLTYFKHSVNPGQDEMVQARRTVKVTDRKTGSTLTGPSVDFFRAVKGVRDSDDVLAAGRPVVRYLPTAATRGGSPPKPWTITADHLRGFGQSRLWGGGTAIVDRDSFHVTSDSLDVESGKRRVAKFLGTPATLQRLGSDTLLVHGETIRLAFTGDTLRAVLALGKGEVVRGSGTILGDSVQLAFEQEKLARTDVWGAPGSAKVHSSGYDAGGDSIVVETPGEKLRSMRTFGHGVLVNPRDTLHPVLVDSAEGGPPGRDTLWGDRILAAFEERDSAGTRVTRVSGIQAFGSASSQYAYNAGKPGDHCPTLTYFTADTILVRMKPGDSTGVADVRYHGHVVGYVAEKASVNAASRDTTRAANGCRSRKS